MMTVVAFSWVPDFAKGHVRDLRVRWALEEMGLPYEVRLIGMEEKARPDYRALQPFAQVPVLIDGAPLFESGAILLRLAERSPQLLPEDETRRWRAISWLFAALNTIEIHVGALAEIDIFAKGQDWTVERRPQVVAILRQRLDELAAALGDKEHLDGAFTVGDLMMATVLRDLGSTTFVTDHPVLGPYLARCLARPAFERALAAQLADFEAKPPN